VKSGEVRTIVKFAGAPLTGALGSIPYASRNQTNAKPSPSETPGGQITLLDMPHRSCAAWLGRALKPNLLNPVRQIPPPTGKQTVVRPKNNAAVWCETIVIPVGLAERQVISRNSNLPCDPNHLDQVQMPAIWDNDRRLNCAVSDVAAVEEEVPVVGWKLNIESTLCGSNLRLGRQSKWARHWLIQLSQRLKGSLK
jgi:hypothetical protein